jgi:hypothetical protein
LLEAGQLSIDGVKEKDYQVSLCITSRIKHETISTKNASASTVPTAFLHVVLLIKSSMQIIKNNFVKTASTARLQKNRAGKEAMRAPANKTIIPRCKFNTLFMHTYLHKFKDLS